MLSEIQSKLKAPKGQVNKFGNYKYRSCEDIIEAVKPILAAHKAALVISDEIVMVGERVYVKATARLTGPENTFIGEATAYAREQESKKGMDEAQITGSASSYARKYALNGLFAIDDTKDADTLSPEDNQAPAKLQSKDYADHINVIKAAIAEGDLSTAAEEWFTLDDEIKAVIFQATSKGGQFTTKERDIMKSTEFREAYYGVTS